MWFSKLIPEPWIISLQDKHKTEHINQNHRLSKRYPKDTQRALSTCQFTTKECGFWLCHPVAWGCPRQFLPNGHSVARGEGLCESMQPSRCHGVARGCEPRACEDDSDPAECRGWKGQETNQTEAHIKLWNAVVNYKQRCVFLQKHWGRVLFNKSALSTTALPTQCANTALLRHSHSSSNTVLPTQCFQQSPSNAVLPTQPFNYSLLTQLFWHIRSNTAFPSQASKTRPFQYRDGFCAWFVFRLIKASRQIEISSFDLPYSSFRMRAMVVTLDSSSLHTIYRYKG